VSDAPVAAAHHWDATLALMTRHRPSVIAGAVAAVFAIAYLIAPLTGQDLAAQIARADFARDHPFTPVDLRWFGGSLTFGYSLWTPLVMAWVGVRLTGAVCAVAATVLVTLLFERTGAHRPALGGTLAAVAQAINLVAGRVTFSLGMVCGLGALLALVSLRDSFPWRGAVLAFLAGAASPVDALYLWLCGGALLLVGRRQSALVLIASSALPVAVISGMFGDGGDEPFSGRDFRDALLAALVVLLVVPIRRIALRVGAGLAVVMAIVAYLVDTPVGNNVTRLTMLFAVPVVAAYVTWRPWLTALAVVAAGYPQQVSVHYSFTYGPSADEAYYAPLVAEITAGGPLVGRVEIPETTAHWDDAFVARSVPLARGWIRQVDIGLNDAVFFDAPPSPTAYRTWLRANAVQYVAVPDAALTKAGTNEAITIEQHPGYLRPIWSNEHWQLFEVESPVPIVGAPGRLVAMDEAGITLDAPAAATVAVNARWFRWLSLDGPGGCITESEDGHVQLVANEAGRYRLASSLRPSGHC
jgi:MFS family permease